jgi:hypothetical protein
VSPVCGRCQREVSRLARVPLDGVRVCRRCETQAGQLPCVDCGTLCRPGLPPVAGVCSKCGLRRAKAADITAMLDEIVAIIATIEVDMDAAVIRDAVHAVAPRRDVHRRLLDALKADPQVLTSGMATGPMIIDRVIGALTTRGATVVVTPRCVRCSRTGGLSTRCPQGRICGSCLSLEHLIVCAVCGQQRPSNFHRNNTGAPVCTYCHRNDPARHEPCEDCGRVRAVGRRLADGAALCPACYQRRARSGGLDGVAMAVCAVCGQHGHCIGITSGYPRCDRCYPHRRAVCVDCGRVRDVAASWPGGPRCERCRSAALSARATCDDCGQVRRPDPRSNRGGTLCTPCAGLQPFSTCQICGAEERLSHAGRCDRCVLINHLDRLVSQAVPDRSQAMAKLRTALLDRQPTNTLQWLQRPRISATLARIAAGDVPLDHDLGNNLPERVANHLRHLLMSAGVIEAHDTTPVRFHQWAVGQLEQVNHPDMRRQLESFLTWEIERRLRRRAEHDFYTSTSWAMDAVRSAARLLNWLEDHDRTLATVRQADIDLWLASGPPSRRDARHLLVWATKRRLTTVTIPPPPSARLRAVVPTATTESVIHRLLNDDTLKVSDRVAGLLVMLYAQPLTRITQLRLSDISTNHTTTIRLGRDPIEFPPGVAVLVDQLTQQRCAATDVTGSPWLFPGAIPGRPLGSEALGNRLRRIGVNAGATRTTTLLDLAKTVPPIALADLLGMSYGTAIKWIHHSAGDWTSYAAIRSQNV